MDKLTDHEQYLQSAANLTAEQLRQAIGVAEGVLGRAVGAADGALVGAVLIAISENYRAKTR